ncbi:hypothetical protein [Edaphobacter albus]|uniref:hypothetical protein n=1 Tax=Edaphobacter sp. 4G125 TaxID=2763071 RepID=UPI0016459C0A|nr:hypothetical protein [Edaphobacter sp. 4G125]QNI36937.1 hypothetical protein H7846_00920 [Edaphobacter sp. 4G125]
MKDRIRSAITGVVLAATATCVAQTHKVAPTPETVVRAVGVYEWTGDLSKPTGSRFVPVTVFINGDLEDAGFYKPQPVPFALLSGNIYQLQDAGLPKGDLVLETALNARLPDGAPGPAFDAGWTAYGTYKPLAASKPATALKPSKNLPVIQVSGGDSSKPHLTNKSGDNSASKGTNSGKQGTKSGSGTDTNDTTTSSNDPDRPTMHRRTAPDDTAGTSSGSGNGSGTTDSSNDPAERPTLKRRSPEEEKAAKEQKKKNDIATVTGAGSLNDDPDRPRLKRGDANKDGGEDMPKLMGLPKDMHQMVAVSDAKNRDTHPFARPWEDSNEHAAILTKMQGFARAKLAAYGVVPGITPPSAIAGVATAPATGTISDTTPDSGPPTLKRGIPQKSSVTTEDKPLPTQASASTPAPKVSKTTAKRAGTKGHHATTVSPVTLADEELKGYTLSYGGSPTYVYMAHTVETGSVMRYVTIVAQDNGMGELKIALASVTDAAHLDRTPWMRLVDAVDVEASNRASLLFELRGQTSRQFALYRVIAAKSEQIFPEANAM